MNPSPPLSPEQGRKLLELARRALESYYRLDTETREPIQVTPSAPIGGLFATLERRGELRGCIGFLSPGADLGTLVERAVIAAAVEDPRFPRVTESEIDGLSIRLSILSPMVPLENFREIDVGRHGLVVERAGARGLLLPQVARERGWDRERFLTETCRKAGLAPKSLHEPGTKVLCFEAHELSESPRPG